MTVATENIAAVVVLYQPGPDVLENIRTWAAHVAHVYIFDNSETNKGALSSDLVALGNSTYVSWGENRGIAAALNSGAESAIVAGFNFLLTMDQDSRAEPDMVVRMLDCTEGLDIAKVGIISPFHVTAAGMSARHDIDCQDVMTPMTSGNLLNLQAYKKVGPFRDDLFIDFVDNEYCLRLRQRGFQVLRANRALLYHNVGDTHKYGPFIATNHSPLRRYYKTRNRFLVNRLYKREFPGHCLFDRVRLVKEIVSILLFEREKSAKLRMMWRGYMDYRRGRFGRFEG
jgi:rhamnosyltransferase